MALHVYRFRRDQTASLAALESVVGTGLTVVDNAAGMVVDYQADSTQLADLIEAQARGGFTFLSTDPVTPPDDDVVFSAMTQAQHRTLRQLIHFIDEQGPANGFASGAFRETTPTSPFPTSEIWWTSAAKTHKIVEETVTYNSNKTIATDQWKMYDVDGVTVIATVTDTMTYSGVFEATRTRTIA